MQPISECFQRSGYRECKLKCWKLHNNIEDANLINKKVIKEVRVNKIEFPGGQHSELWVGRGAI